ncbi:MAG: type II toxin-antitoxin system PemK/MazF family toxin [Gemmataceae bacterium]|nr:type II toxin-antitoxin system PemK/MazF family toxin [Gemmataceae bacterium]
MASPGSVVLIDLVGAVVRKVRPALVVSSGIYHATRPDVIVAVLTSNLASATDPTDYALVDWAAAGLHQPTAFRAFIATRPATEIIREIGRLTDQDWQEVQARLRIALGL